MDGVRLRSAALAFVLAPACLPGPEPVTPSPTVDEAPPCTQERLAAFEPSGNVIDRGPLPSMEQATEAHTEELITLPCSENEDDEACLARAEARAKEAFATGTITESGVGVDREVVRAELLVAGREEVVTAESLVALAELITARREAGEPVTVAGAERIAAPDAERAAVIRVRLPGRTVARRALRAYLVLDAPASPVRAILDLQLRASEARLSVRGVEPQPDGTLRVELGCERPLEPAEAARSAAPR